MRKGTTLALMAAIAVACVAFGAASAGAATTVTVGNNFFSPAKKSVARGAKVNFRWTGGERHNVVKTRGPGGSIESDTTARRGVNFSKRFRKAGTYRFICTLHPSEMRLKLTVR